MSDDDDMYNFDSSDEEENYEEDNYEDDDVCYSCDNMFDCSIALVHEQCMVLGACQAMWFSSDALTVTIVDFDVKINNVYVQIVDFDDKIDDFDGKIVKFDVKIDVKYQIWPSDLIFDIKIDVKFDRGRFDRNRIKFVDQKLISNLIVKLIRIKL